MASVKTRFKGSRFIYVISNDEISIKQYTKKIRFGRLNVGLSDNDIYQILTIGDKGLLLIGWAVNLNDGSTNIQYLINESNCIDDVIEKEYCLGGKYLLLVRFSEDYYLLGDAITSIPIFYHTKNKIYCSFSENAIAEHFSYTPDSQLLEIRNSGDVSMAMPFDICTYKEIRQLLPNHYLYLNDNTSHRFINSYNKQEGIDSKTAIKNTLNRVKVLSDYYISLFKPLCPITSGRDSRAVLAILRESNPNTKCYTIAHKEFDKKTQDIVIPRELQKELNFEYIQIEDEVVPSNLKTIIENILGTNSFSCRTLYIAYTILKNFGQVAIVNGDIIGQIGKCSLHRNIPERLATPRYFRCKLHKHSHSSLDPLKEWMDEIKKSGEKVNLFDLFSIENRLGRWAGQENIIYNLLGIIYLNIFNSRSIIYEWTKVNRSERMKSQLHLCLIENSSPNLLCVPFEKDNNLLIRMSKKNWLLFYLSSFMKFYCNKTFFKTQQ